MKNILQLLMLLTVFCTAGGAPATAQNKGAKDSVKIPRYWWKAASADLERYDDCKIEVGKARAVVGAQQDLISKLSAQSDLQRERIGDLGAMRTADSLLGARLYANYQTDLEALQAQVKQATRRLKFSTLQKVLIGIGAGAMGFWFGYSLK